MHLTLDEMLHLFEFAGLDAKITPWGYMHEVDLGSKANMLVKVIRVNDGHRTSLQYHREKDEVLMILEGEGYLEIHYPEDSAPPARYTYEDKEPFRIKPGRKHRAVGPLLMLEVSTRHPDDVVRVEDDYGRG